MSIIARERRFALSAVLIVLLLAGAGCVRIGFEFSRHLAHAMAAMH